MASNDIDIVIGAKNLASAAIDRVVDGIGGLQKRLAGINPVMLAGGAAVAGMAAGFVALKSAVDAVSEASARIDELAKNARSIGASVDGLQSLQAALRNMSGTEAEDVNSALKEMQLRIGEMASGIGSQEQLDIMAQLGLDPKKLAAMDPVEQFTRMNDAIVSVQNTAERASIADKLFGGDSVRLLSAFNADVGELQKNMQDAADRGLVLSDAQAAGVEAMNRAMARISSSVEGITNQVAAALGPVVEEIAIQLDTWAEPLIAMTSDFLPMIINGFVELAGYVTELAIAAGKFAAFDFSGGIQQIENLGQTSEAWIERIRQSRERAAEEARKAEEQRQALSKSAEPIDMAAVQAQKDKAAAAAKLVEQLERQLAVAQTSEDLVKRQEQLALATNDAERERIRILQSQIAEQEKLNKLAEEKAARDLKATEELGKEFDRRQKELADRASNIAKLRPGVDATESRLLTRGLSDDPSFQTAENTKAMVGALKDLPKKTASELANVLAGNPDPFQFVEVA